MTPQQKKLLDFIIKFQKENGYTPSFEEMSCGIGQASKSGIHKLMRGLEERGYIETRRYKRRYIEILKTKIEPKKLKSETILRRFIKSKNLQSEYLQFYSQQERA